MDYKPNGKKTCVGNIVHDYVINSLIEIEIELNDFPQPQINVLD